LVVERAHLESELLPRVEVVRGRDGAARTLGAADTPVLVEGRSALDRGLVDTRTLVDVVRGTIRCDCALVCERAGRVVCAKVLEDIVLDERVGGPTVDGEVGVTRGRVVGGEGDIPVGPKTVSKYIRIG
jgi:hypothetical protein